MLKQANSEDFQSRWEYSKATSGWHFDKFKDENKEPSFSIVGRFKPGPWQQEIDDLLKAVPTTPVTFASRIAGRFPGKIPYTLRMDEYDLEKMGLPASHVLYHNLPLPRTAVWLQRMVEFFQLRETIVSVHVQYPGQTFPFHIDALTSSKSNSPSHPLDLNPHLLARFEIQLLDWEWGHVWAYGNTYWKQWRAGEIASHVWRDVPHGTANCGHTPRCVLQVTGRVTEFSRQLMHQRNALIDLGRVGAGCVA